MTAGGARVFIGVKLEQMTNKENLSFTGNINQLKKYGSGAAALYFIAESAPKEDTRKQAAKPRGKRVYRENVLTRKQLGKKSGETAVKTPKKRRKV